MSDKFYDEKTKLWGCLEPIEGTNKKIAVGQIILDLIFSYGSKVAQVKFLSLAPVNKKNKNEDSIFF